MLKIESPSMVLNDERAPSRFVMDFSHTVRARDSVESMVHAILAAARRVRGRKKQIRNLVINAHGLPGIVQIGTGLDLKTLAPLARIRGKVSKIWMHTCLVARTINFRTINDGDFFTLQAGNIRSGNGHAFISMLARLTGCHVVAPTEIQGSHASSFPKGRIDNYEGLVLSYNPKGAISWQGRNPSMYDVDWNEGTATNPCGED